jgi:phosphoribosylformimino-5-aminoimidazole carboxamide ribotide isomerase
MEIIPAIDLLEGRCVRLRQGQYDQTTFYEVSPLEWAQQAEAAGLRRVHLVDLEGARDGTPRHVEVLRAMSEKTGLEIDFGGGIRTEAELEKILEAGAHYVVVGSMAVHHPEDAAQWMARFGPERFILAADVRYGRLRIEGWKENPSTSLRTLLRWFAEQGGQQVLCTDIGRDGMLRGPNYALYRTQIQQHPDLRFIASGGVSNIRDVADLKAEGLYGVVIGKALFEQRFTFAETLPYLE